MRLRGTKLSSIAQSGGLGNQLWDLASSRPSLDLQFADTKSLVDATTGQNLVTFSRASGGTYVDSQGVIKTALDNEPRFDHNPTTGESLGLLVEEPRANGIRNNTMVGAVAGTPGIDPTNWITAAVSGAITSKQIVGVGAENGINYVDLRYTTDAAVTFNVCVFEQATQIAAATGQTWTGSVYLKLASGSLSNTSLVHRVMYRTSAGASVTTNDVSIVPTSAALSLQRTSNSFAASGATIAAVTSQIVVTTTGSSDFTLRIGMPQLEQGAFATSVIPTTGTAATRAADIASITGTNFSSWYNQSEGTVFCGFSRSALIGSSNFANLWAISDNTASERFLAYNTGNTQTIDTVVTDGGVAQGVLIAPGAITANSIQNHAFVYKVNDFAAVRNAGSVITDTSGSLPAVDRIYIGANHNGGGQFSGAIRRLTFWPQRLSNATLQSITQ